jgi:4-amino-4-deoxy-L-arabinose transferase-like glycosyltransferase
MHLIGSTLFFFIALIFFSFFTWSYPLISPDEPRYAETAREMLDSGKYIIPYLDGIPRFAKPVLFYWLDAFSFKLFGVNEFAARIPSLVAGSGVVSLAFLFGSINGVGILTAVVTMSSLGIFIASKLAITDMLLCFFITAALIFLYLGFDQTTYRNKGDHDKRFSISVFLAFIMMALGFLTKGPIAILIPILVIAIFLFLKGDIIGFLQSFYIEIFLGITAMLLINIPWYVLVHIASNGEFTKEFFFADNISRFLKPHTGHSAPFWFYIPVIFCGLFPWSFFLLQSIFAQDFSSSLNLKSEKKRQELASFFCGIWALVVFLFFSFSSTKLPTYILPIFVALSFFIARWWQQRFHVTRSQNSRNLGLFWGMASFSISILIVFLAYIFKIKELLVEVDPNAFLVPIILIAGFYLAAGAIAMTSVFSNAKISFAFFAVANLLCLTLVTPMILKPFAEYRDGGSKAFAQNLKADAEIRTLICHPSRFSFYSQSIVREIKPKQVKAYFEKNPNGNLVLRTKNITVLEKRSRKDAFQYQELNSNRIFTFVKASPLVSPIN